MYLYRMCKSVLIVTWLAICQNLSLWDTFELIFDTFRCTNDVQALNNNRAHVYDNIMIFSNTVNLIAMLYLHHLL